MTDRPCRNAIFEGTNGGLHKGVHGGQAFSFYTPTNSVYIIPGFVDHVVFKLENPTVIRHAVVVFIKPRGKYVFRKLILTADDDLQMTWAIGFVSSGETVICDKCYKVYKTKLRREKKW